MKGFNRKSAKGWLDVANPGASQKSREGRVTSWPRPGLHIRIKSNQMQVKRTPDNVQGPSGPTKLLYKRDAFFSLFFSSLAPSREAITGV